MFENWSNALVATFQDIWVGIANFVPDLIAAIIIFVIGWIVGSIVGKVISQVFRSIKVDQALRSAGVEEVTKRAGYNLDSGKFVGGLVEWFIIVVFLVAALDVLQLTQVNIFLQEVVLLYLPRVIVAVLILLVAVVIADAMQRVVVASARAANVRSANFLGSVTKWAIWIFAILTVLYQLGIATGIIQTLYTGFVVAISLAVGLAFGLGGQNAASEVIDSLKRDVTDRR